MIRFLELNKINSPFEKEFQNSFNSFLTTGYYILGNSVEEFESNFGKYCGTKYCIGVSNGLDALTLILKGFLELGKLKKGDEVIVPANTYIATILAVIRAGLKPVLVEPNDDTFNIDPEKIAQVISKKTKAIIPVHLYGQLAEMSIIMALADSYNLLVIEDAAQAHGARNSNNILAGNLGHAAGFSFYPTKNLGALGDGGCITTNDPELAKIVIQLRNYGQSQKYVSDIVGFNARLDEIQAMFLNVKLRTLDEDNSCRRKNANFYLSGINNPKLKLPQFSGEKDHVFHQFVIRTNNQLDFSRYMNKNNVETIIHYPVPPHKQKVLKDFNNLNLPITEQICKSVISIPINPALSKPQIYRIIELLNNY